MHKWIAMEKRIHMLGAVGTLILVLGATTIVAQAPEYDICVLEHLTAKELTGKVVSARLDNEIERPIPGAVVELRQIGEQQVIEKTVTDSTFISPS
jgi:hypothetical protein